MAHKQVNALATLSGIAADDLIPIFDSSEAGDEKLKKYTVQELKSDLTSIDPSAFGNWIQVYNITGTTFNNADSYPKITDISTEKYVKMSVTIEAVASASIIMLSAGDDDGWDTSGANYAGTVSGRQVISSFSASGKAVMDIIYEPKTKVFTITGTYYDGTSISNLNVSILYKGTKTPTKIMFQSWNSVSINITGELSIYKWQEVKPIELHSYELVKEYNLNNETLDDTFDWDGETDDIIVIETDLTKSSTANIEIFPNGDTGSNYDYAWVGQDNSSSNQGYGDGSDNIGLCNGQAGRSYSKTIGILKNTGEYRMFKQTRINNLTNNSDAVIQEYGYRWKNTSNDITSFSVASTGSVTGFVRVYKLAKTHLFNQTIYNNTTLNVTTTGSDTTGDGTSQKPFATINGALAWLKNKTINNDVNVIIQLADGTYNNHPAIDFRFESNRIYIVGNQANPANVVLNFPTSINGIAATGSTFLRVGGLKLVGYEKSEWKSGFVAQQGATVYADNCIIDNFGAGGQAVYNGNLNVITGFTFNNCIYGLSAYGMGNVYLYDGTISNCTNDIVANVGGRAHYGTVTFTSNSQNTYATTGGSITNG